MPAQPYWWDNAARPTRGFVDCQLSLTGGIVWRDATGERAVQAGDVMLFRHGDATAYGRPTGGASVYRCWWVELAGAGLTEHWGWLAARHGGLLRGATAEAIRPALDELLRVAERSAAGPIARLAAVQRFVHRLVEIIEDDRQRAGRPVDLAIDHLLREPERIRSVDALAARWRVSREHLSRACRERLGASPARWLAERRLASACRLLDGTCLDADEVARQSGYPEKRSCLISSRS